MQWIVLLSFYCHFTKKLLGLLTFSHETLFKKSLFLKFSDKINSENTLFVSKSIHNLLPSLFNDWLLFSSDQYNYESTWSSLGNRHKLTYKTNIYEKNSIILSAINAWNNLQKLLKISIRCLLPKKIKNTVSDVFWNEYWNEYWNEPSIFRFFKLILDYFLNFGSTISVLTENAKSVCVDVILVYTFY